MQTQRTSFIRALQAAESGNWSGVEPELTTLQGYPLQDDLRGAWLAAGARTLPERDIVDYLLAHPSLYASARLRLRWTNRLYREKRWQDFLDQYNEFYADTNDAALQCLALLASRQVSDEPNQAEHALELWLVGHSQPRECDPVFAWLADTQLLTSARYRERLELALAANNFQLADYLAGFLTDSDRALVDLYRRVTTRPETELARQNFKNSERARLLILDGLEQLARRDPDQAAKLWHKQYRRDFSFTREQKLRMQKAIAFWSAQRLQPNSLKRMASLPAAARDIDGLAWWARAALSLGDWDHVSRAINAMPDKMAAEDAWQDWAARALQAQGDSDSARQILLALSGKRGYYGFLAADELFLPYAFGNRETLADESILAALAARPGLVRAGEWFATGLDSRGRQEWDAVIAQLDPPWQVQASILAHRLGWHSRAITIAAQQQLFDDLTLRYPPAYIDMFQNSAGLAGIDTAWAMGIARSESLFIPDVKSSAGAIGLMQLMPATGASTAREFHIPYRSSDSLLDPQTNILLGTRYLGKMQSLFGNHQVLSTAAYNAGPNRISSWLPVGEEISAELWIETLPYGETRKYLRRVLESQIIFAWSQGRPELRLKDILAPVPSAVQLQAQLLPAPAYDAITH
ncbi:MAG: transglycosylase SLT domain-containing protein [Gammaproteobacteria bacterium]|nr:transglycosylase SLT domain-containing protein [Gammaproteobacteria bacterium]